MEDEPLKAPRRLRPQVNTQERSGMVWVLVLGLMLIAAIAFQHLVLAPAGMMPGKTATAGDADQGGGYGPQRAMNEAPLQRAPELPGERFAAPVHLKSESDLCTTLRDEHARMQNQLRRAGSSAQQRDLERQMRDVRDRGAERGCWSGGAG